MQCKDKKQIFVLKKESASVSHPIATLIDSKLSFVNKNRVYKKIRVKILPVFFLDSDTLKLKFLIFPAGPQNLSSTEL